MNLGLTPLGVAPVSNFVTNNLNQYTAIDGTPQTFDLKGNLLIGGTSAASPMTNSYDAQNRLVSVARGTNTATFVYDGRNRCIQRTINGTTTDMVYDDWSLIAEYSGSTPICEYIQVADEDEVIARADSTATTYYIGDAVNSTAALTDASGNVIERYRFTTFGQPSIYDTNSNLLASSFYGNRFAFQGREYFAELNLTDHRNRYYSPELQRWLNRDLIGETGGKNLYAFVKNNPNDNTDPLGEITFVGCGSREQLITDEFETYCNKIEDPKFKCCLGHFNIPQRLKSLCDRRNTLTVICKTKSKGWCKGACAWSIPGGHTIRLCPTQWTDPGCGLDNVGCTLLHEMTHIIGHPFEKWPTKVENCLGGCRGQ